MLNRPENEAFQRFTEAQRERLEEWPEPETTSLFNVLRRGAQRVVASVLGHRRPDVAAEVAERALLCLRNFHGRSQFSTWFYRIARNEAIRAVTERVSREEQFSEGFEPEASTGEMLAVQGLNAVERAVLQAMLSGFNIEVIADILKCSRATAYRRREALRKKLKELL